MRDEFQKSITERENFHNIVNNSNNNYKLEVKKLNDELDILINEKSILKSENKKINFEYENHKNQLIN